MTKDMTSGSPLKMILFFSIPVLLGNLFQQFYNMVDTIIVGRYLGEEALAAVGSTGSLMFLVLGFANGIQHRALALSISHAFGAKDFPLLKHYVALSLMLTVVVSANLSTVSTRRGFQRSSPVDAYTRKYHRNGRRLYQGDLCRHYPYDALQCTLRYPARDWRQQNAALLFDPLPPF